MIRWVEPVKWTTTALDELRAKVAREALRAPEELVRRAAETLGLGLQAETEEAAEPRTMD